MRSALQYAYIAALSFFAIIAGQFCALGIMTGNCIAWIISLSCLSASLLTIILRAMFLS